ncbi:MAG: PDZ domain-containing protein [Nitrospirae bacterium]|nr:PDZ domain-containing protein [Nitrospirota bacterium]MBI3594528.1 PDZ domain-containing protein [Nitrospirota bacterium]
MGSINKNWLISLFSVTIISFLLADVTNLLIGSKLEASASLLPKGVQEMSRPASTLSGTDEATLIVEGNIFNSKLRGKKEERVASLAPVISPPINLQARFRLVGTSEGDPENSFAIIEDLQSKEQIFYHLNDRLIDQVRISQILRNQVRLAYAGGAETLRLQLDEERSAVPPTSLPAGPASLNNSILEPKGIRQLSSNRWALDRQEVEHNLDNLNQLMTQARVIPNFSDGKPDGFRVFAIVPDSFYEKIGLKNGDVLERVNGVEIKDPESFLKVFQHLKDENNISIDVVRNSQKETMSYEIR